MQNTPNSTQDEQPSEPDMRSKYDFRDGVRGKYVHRLPRGVQRDMIPEHAQKEWDEEIGATQSPEQ